MQQQHIRECFHIPVTENKYRICHSISVKVLQEFCYLVQAYVPVEREHEWRQIHSFPSYCNSPLGEQMAGISNSTPPHPTPSLPQFLPLSPLACRWRTTYLMFSFCTSNQRSQLLLLNQPQMCRHSYLTTSADGTLFWGWAQKTSVLARNYFGSPWVSHWDHRSRTKTHLLRFFFMYMVLPPRLQQLGGGVVNVWTLLCKIDHVWLEY